MTPDIVVETSIQDEIAIQRLWAEQSIPKPKDEVKPEAKETPKEAPAEEPAGDEKPMTEKEKTKPFVDVQLQRAVDALKVLELFHPETVQKDAA